MIDFPTNPTLNQIHISNNGKKWTWNGVKWTAINLFDTASDVNVVDSSTVDLNWSTSTKTLSATVPSINLIPPGAVMSFARNTPPDGWLSCNGAAISRSTYSSLFNAIGTTFGVGDNTSTFNLPDFRGEFIRGWDAGKGTDTGRTFGSSQLDEFKSHSHVEAAGQGSGGSISGWNLVNTPNRSVLNISTEPTGGTETRPRNIALLYCIKF